MENESQKYLNEEQYRTIFVKADENEDALNDSSSALISLLTDPTNKEFKEDGLILLKKEKAGHLLINAIKQAKEHQHVLVAACWESEINFSEHLTFFVELVMDNNYLVAIEAMTVIENMEGPFDQNQIKESILKLKEFKKSLSNEKLVLVNDLLDFLNQQS